MPLPPAGVYGSSAPTATVQLSCAHVGRPKSCSGGAPGATPASETLLMAWHLDTTPGASTDATIPWLIRYAIRDPSGDQAAPVTAPSSLTVNGTAMAARKSCIHNSMLPVRALERATLVPSGDHAGSSSTNGSSVPLIGWPPIGSTQRSPSASNATLAPSGDTTGLTMPRSGCGSDRSSARCAAV